MMVFADTWAKLQWLQVDVLIAVLIRRDGSNSNRGSSHRHESVRVDGVFVLIVEIIYLMSYSRSFSFEISFKLWNEMPKIPQRSHPVYIASEHNLTTRR